MKLLKFLKAAYLLVFIAMIMSYKCMAQVGKLDSKGKEFWAVFMENLGGSPFENSRLLLYASSETKTTVHVYYNDGTPKQITVPINVINKPVEIPIPWQMELNRSDTGVTSKSVLVLADNEITLYGANIRLYSADAFVSFPEDVLTRKYIVLAYPNGYLVSQNGNNPPEYDTPSQFAIIAPYDGTELSVKSPAGTRLNGAGNSAPFKVYLNKGEVYFAQAELGVPQDVSGTEVNSNKPIAVYAGTKRSSIPTSVGTYRDHLCEQIPPLEIWGKSVIATPHYPVSKFSPYTAVVRVLAALDNTNWKLNGAPQAPLMRGDSRELPLTDVLLITAENPILVAQYEHSVGNNQIGDLGDGDPFMMIIPPYEQYDTTYSVQSIIDSNFTSHYINVIVPKNHTDSLTIDGVDPNTVYKPVPGTDYVYAQINVPAGSHFLRCDTAFGCCLYGFGEATSYGYVGGILFKKVFFDYQPPVTEIFEECNGLNGFSHDSHLIDSGIDSCYALNAENVSYQIEKFVSTKDTVRFSAKLIDPYQDGNFAIRAIDSGGRLVNQYVNIPGFTIKTVGMNGNQPLLLDSIFYINNTPVCREFELTNYGKYERTITGIKLPDSLNDVIQNGAIKIKGNFPLKLKPNEKAKIEICVEGFVRNYPVDVNIILTDDCNLRTVAVVPVIGLIDTLPPNMQQNIEQCGAEATYKIYEPTGRSTKIQNIKLQLDNVKVENDSAINNLPSFNVEFRVSLVDKFKDGFITITSTDAAGNTITKLDTLFGFTVHGVEPKSTKPVGVRFSQDYVSDNLHYTSWRCDTLILENYGLKERTITAISFYHNSDFSLPPSNFPIIILPKSKVLLPVCISGRFIPVLEDTMFIYDNCNTMDKVLFRIAMNTKLDAGFDWCKNRMSINATDSVRQNFITTLTPNPVTKRFATIDIGLQKSDLVNMEIYNEKGDMVGSVFQNEPIANGIHRITLDFIRATSGNYFIKFRTNSGFYQIVKCVIHQ